MHEKEENLLQNTAKDGIITTTDGWIACPECRRNKRLLRITDRTEAVSLPVFCRVCKREIILNIERGQSVKRQSP